MCIHAPLGFFCVSFQFFHRIWAMHYQDPKQRYLKTLCVSRLTMSDFKEYWYYLEELQNICLILKKMANWRINNVGSKLKTHDSDLLVQNFFSQSHLVNLSSAKGRFYQQWGCSSLKEISLTLPFLTIQMIIAILTHSRGF